MNKDLIGIKELYPSASDFELRILYMADNYCDYNYMKQELSVSKKKVRDILLKFEPSLLNNI